MIYSHFQPILIQDPAFSLSDIHTHIPVASDFSYTPIALRVVSLPGKGSNHLSLQGMYYL